MNFHWVINWFQNKLVQWLFVKTWKSRQTLQTRLSPQVFKHLLWEYHFMRDYNWYRCQWCGILHKCSRVCASERDRKVLPRVDKANVVKCLNPPNAKSVMKLNLKKPHSDLCMLIYRQIIVLIMIYLEKHIFYLTSMKSVFSAHRFYLIFDHNEMLSYAYVTLMPYSKWPFKIISPIIIEYKIYPDFAWSLLWRHTIIST